MVCRNVHDWHHVVVDEAMNYHHYYFGYETTDQHALWVTSAMKNIKEAYTLLLYTQKNVASSRISTFIYNSRLFYLHFKWCIRRRAYFVLEVSNSRCTKEKMAGTKGHSWCEQQLASKYTSHSVILDVGYLISSPCWRGRSLKFNTSSCPNDWIRWLPVTPKMNTTAAAHQQ